MFLAISIGPWYNEGLRGRWGPFSAAWARRPLGLKPLRQKALVALLHYFYNLCEDTSRRRYFRGERTRYAGANALNDGTTHDCFRAGHLPALLGSGALWAATPRRQFGRPPQRCRRRKGRPCCSHVTTVSFAHFSNSGPTACTRLHNPRCPNHCMLPQSARRTSPIVVRLLAPPAAPSQVSQSPTPAGLGWRSALGIQQARNSAELHELLLTVED